MPRVNGLSEMQKRFVYHYVARPNGTRAAISAGYSPRSARAIASENLTKPNIIEAVEEKKRKIYDEQRLKERLTDVIESPDNQTVLVNAIRVGMLERTMLTERNINENTNRQVPLRAIEGLSTEDLADELVNRLRLSSSGISPQAIEAKGDAQ